MIERRTFKVEVRNGADGKVKGYAAVFNSESENLGGYREIIAPGAFTDALGDDVRCLMNHDDNRVLGRSASGTLTVSQDEKGLMFECDMPDTSYARDLAVSMDRGDIDQCSFQFRVAPMGSSWDEDDNGVPVRTVTKISRLYDVSIVTFPAYTATSAELRSNADILSEFHRAGQSAPPAQKGGGVDLDLLRRKLELAYYEHQ